MIRLYSDDGYNLTNESQAELLDHIQERFAMGHGFGSRIIVTIEIAKDTEE